ncbi:hypothetical protein F4820DRAFT_450946 [Hypoxylon rubiginosum]|uniref:Uncharacterized protein n=1 Tax=Hypoxylon rubiginosum TaxID=110542 RepID=A0ACB9YSQ8_9PEZI|nr:hypothetical protein F4820DRAFT_450946 [Hypoxylon rubiginosum]
MSDPGVEVSDSAEFWQLDVNITYNSSHPLGPEYENNSDSYVPSIKAILYDSALPVNYSDMFNTQGSPLGRLLRHAITIPAVTATPKWPAYVDTFRTIDGAGDLKLKYAQNYKFYHGQRPWLTWDNQLGTKCDVGRNGTAPCQLSLPFTFSSPMVTVERSSRGTDTLTILIDEGSILGAILFFTWFFGIFIT